MTRTTLIKYTSPLFLLLIGAVHIHVAGGPVIFERIHLSDADFESASVADVNGNGYLDIISGAYWYKGPDFEERIKFQEPMPAGEYYDDFSNFPMDISGNGYPDIITGGFFGGPLRWLRNPGPDSRELWEVVPIEQIGSIETTRFWDVTGDGHLEVVPNAGPDVYFYTLNRDEDGTPIGSFTKHMVRRGVAGHGLGFGDINGNGRGDILTPTGWLEAPEDRINGEWQWHQEFNIGYLASVPMLVHDVNGNGKSDIIVGNAHGYGLEWLEQRLENGRRTWVRHQQQPNRSQFHDMVLVDLDNDGQLDLISGKRYRAHNGLDPGADDPVFVAYYKINGGDFQEFLIDYGPSDRASGLGIYFWVEDINGNGWVDIVAPGKEGLYLFLNMGPVGGTDGE